MGAWSIVRKWEGSEKGANDGKRVSLMCSLFADDITIVGMREEIDEGVIPVKSVMNEWKEPNNEAKKEVFEYRMNEGGSVRALVSWVSASADVNNRINRANRLCRVV